MIEYINREAAINSLTEEKLVLNLDSVMDGLSNQIKRSAHRILASLPAADVVEVVRCRECVHCCGVSGEPPFEEAYEAYCDEHDWCVSKTYFCADGKRKDGEQNE